MENRASSCGRRLLAAVVVALLIGGRAVGYTRDSPEVKQTVAKAVAYLEAQRGQDQRFGANSVVAMALIKAGKKGDHPIVQDAIRDIRAELKQLSPNSEHNIVYGVGISLIFLVNLDPETYRPEIEGLLAYLQSVQKPHGGWGYLDWETGDTSMTQYGVLGAWEAAQVGFHVSPREIDDVLDWLLKTQDPSGAYGYQGAVAPGTSLVRQQKIRLSMAAAGAGSLYMCADLLGLYAEGGRSAGIPDALVRIDEATGRPVQDRSRAVARKLWEAQDRSNRWLRSHYDPKIRYVNETADLTYYYLYALERYWSFREAIEGKPDNAPHWYDDGVNFLRKAQRPDGSWEGYCGPSPDTAFAVLFLVRSMKKSIQRARDFGAGTLVGGRGLPKDSDAVVVRQGSVIALPQAQAVEKVLAAVGDEDDEDYLEAINALSTMSAEDAAPMINKNAERLRKLAGAASADARLAAVRALAKARNMDDVPVLIYAMTDPDPAVVLAARDGLRRISRRFHGFGLPDDFNDAQRRAAVEDWKDWYKSVRPDAEFSD